MKDYRRKRDFTKTPEPAPGRLPRRRSGPLEFVVHRHDARNLHWDLRLEIAGALRSWAVPKGFTYDRKVKHLAVQTEDHPLEYLEFKGVIPDGQYGAGDMSIWDRGHYRLARGDDADAECASGELKIVLAGQRLHGEWHLVRTRGGGRQPQWLLFKSGDRYEGVERDVLLRTDWRLARPAAPGRRRRMTPAAAAAPLSDPAWAFELDFDGLRVWVEIDGESVAIRAGGRQLAGRLPAVAEDLRGAHASRLVLDGVLVALDDRRRPDAAVLVDALAGGPAAVDLYVFDLLRFDDLDVAALPLLDRKALLRAVLPGGSPRVHFVDHVLADGESLAATAAAAGFARIVGKRTASAYVAGKSADWRLVPIRPDPAARQVAVDSVLGKPAAAAEHRVKLSNLDKVFWPDQGITKGQLLAYYERVAPTLLLYLRDRPVHMNRHPDGITGKSFYQREAPEHVPDWLATVAIASESKGRPVRHMMIQDRDMLLYLVNLGTIDLHPWLSRHRTPDNPDFAVIDLDPKNAPFRHVVAVARTVGEILARIGVAAGVKTSGKSGIHIHVPLRPGYSYDHSRTFCEGIARLAVQRHRDIATIERSPGKRGGKLYVDFLQNRRGQTVVPPYAVRPVPGATVSAPLRWDELDDDLHPSRFTIHTMPPRLAELGDLFAVTLDEPQDLLPAIERLQALLGGS